MPEPGQTIVNPVAGDTVTFVRLPSADATDLVMEMTTLPGGQGPPLHVHPRSSESFTVVSGAIVVHHGGREVVVEQGRTFTVPPGVPHGFAGHPSLAATTRVVMDRPGRMAEFLETFYELNRAGRTDAEGKPAFAQIALTFTALRDDIRPVVAPWPAQLALYAVLRPIARRKGLKPFYRTGELGSPRLKRPRGWRGAELPATARHEPAARTEDRTPVTECLPASRGRAGSDSPGRARVT